MNKRIKTYCIVLSIIYVIVIGSYIVIGFSDFMQGFTQGFFEEGRVDARSVINNEERLLDKQTKHFILKVVPNEGKYTFSNPITNLKDGQTLSTETYVMHARYQSDVNNKPIYLTFFRVIIIVGSFITLITIIYLPFVFFRTVKRIAKNTIIDRVIIRNIRVIGCILIYFFTFGLFAAIERFLLAKELLQIDGYSIVFNFESANYTLLILALVTLILAEILQVSLNMKEEQDLTI